MKVIEDLEKTCFTAKMQVGHYTLGSVEYGEQPYDSSTEPELLLVCHTSKY